MGLFGKADSAVSVSVSDTCKNSDFIWSENYFINAIASKVSKRIACKVKFTVTEFFFSIQN